MSSGPNDPNQPVVASAQPTPNEGSLPGWAKVGLVVGGALLLGTVLDALFSSPRRSPRLPSVPRRALPLSAGEQLAINRKRGERFENVVAECLQDAFPKAAVISQVTVSTPEGKRRRVDHALVHGNGSVTPVEVKNVPELQEKHVRQAEDHRAGVKHTLNARAGLPIVAVPADTVVSAAYESRVRLLRVEGMKSQKGWRKR